MADTLTLEIVTPAGTVYSEDVEMVTLPSIAGQMGILPRHVPLIAQMVPGEMIVRKDGRDVFIATGEGLIEVTGNRVASKNQSEQLHKHRERLEHLRPLLAQGASALLHGIIVQSRTLPSMVVQVGGETVPLDAEEDRDAQNLNDPQAFVGEV